MKSLRTEPIAIPNAVKVVALIAAYFGFRELTDMELEAIVTTIGVLLAVVEYLLSRWQRSKVAPVSATAQKVEQVVIAKTGDAQAARQAANTVRTGELPSSVKR